MPAIKFVKIGSISPVANYLSKIIGQKLSQGQSVLWLVAGGSAMDIAVDTANQLRQDKNLDLLSVCLTDERYGPVGHKDSNWKQLIDRRFDLPGAKLFPVLDGKDFKITAQEYAQMLTQLLETTNYSIAMAGMGPDGHIFGIKPNSPAVDSRELVAAYKWDDYERLTPTFNLIKRLDEVVVYAVGAKKYQQFDDLDKDLSPQQQPAQFLKRLKKVTIFNDREGEPA